MLVRDVVQLDDLAVRPFPHVAIANALKNRAAQIVGWYADATGDEPIPIPEDWLTQRAEEADVTSVIKREAQDRDRIETVVPAAAASAAASAESKKGSARKRQNERKGKGGKQEPEPAAAPKPFTTDEPMSDHEDSIDDLRNLFS